MEIDEEEYLCPISGVVMRDPFILTVCGHTFDKKLIYEWILSHKTCPVCKRHCEVSELIPNFTLKKIIDKKIEQVKNKRQY